MALSEQQVTHLIQQHVGDGFLELNDLIEDYAPGSITVVDLTEFTGRLAEVRAKLAEVRKNVRSILREMVGEENHDNRLMMKGKLDEAVNSVRQHEAEIKAQIAIIRENVPETKTLLTAKVNPEAKKNFAASTLESINDQAEFLVIKLREADDIDSKPDNEKRDLCAKRLSHQEEMFKIKVAFNKAKADIYKEGLDDDSLAEVEVYIEKLEKKIQCVEIDCNKTVVSLKKIDESDELYSTSKLPSATPYPTPKFSGAPGQNLITWLDKMYQAMQDNQVRKNKQVTILRENLEGAAKKLVSENVIDWNEAKKLLVDAYGNPKLLWMDLYCKAGNKLTTWRDKFSDKNLSGTESALEGIRVLQEFLREADLMGKADMNIQLQFENEFDSLCGLCPIPWTRKLLRLEGSHAERLKKFHETLEGEYKLLTRMKIIYQKDTAD